MRKIIKVMKAEKRKKKGPEKTCIKTLIEIADAMAKNSEIIVTIRQPEKTIHLVPADDDDWEPCPEEMLDMISDLADKINTRCEMDEEGWAPCSAQLLNMLDDIKSKLTCTCDCGECCCDEDGGKTPPPSYMGNTTDRPEDPEKGHRAEAGESM